MLSDIIVYFVHATVVVFAALTLWWMVSLAVKNASIIDAFWAFGFLLVAVASFYLAGVTPYTLLLAALPTIWGIRLSAYLGWRTFGHGEDKRYVRMRERSGLSETTWRLRSLLTIFWGQGVLIMIVSAPLWVAMATYNNASNLTNIGLLAMLGALLWLIGFIFETVGDWQLVRFMKANKDYDGPIEEKPVLDTGLWKYTRHPNYFGNACMWWGIWLVACEAPWGWATIFAPLVMTFLLTRVSGKDLLEKDMGRRKSYQRYIERTSGFFPMPPKSKA